MTIDRPVLYTSFFFFLLVFFVATYHASFFSAKILNTMSGPTESSQPTIDPYEKLQIVRNPDGTITRGLIFPESPPSSDPNSSTPVLSKDIPINQSNKTWIRLFLPRHALENSSPSSKLPLIVYFHGGGFIYLSASTTIFHHFCVNLANEVPAVIGSVEYRLAPEHRLPVAYDDAMEALHWIRNSQDDWLRNYADLSNCFLMGGSAGGNIAYNTGLRVVAEGVDQLGPSVKIRGLILKQPYFGATQRSKSELRLMNDPVLPLSVSDLMWEMSLPIGVDRDHEYCNPTVGGGSKMLEQIRTLGWRIFVSGWDGDPLIDRQMEFVKMLEEKGLRVVRRFGVGEYHTVEDVEPSKAKAFHLDIKIFISS